MSVHILHTTDMLSGHERTTAIDTVVSDHDLMSVILRGPMGMTGFERVQMVCKVWLGVCRSDAVLLRGVALYTGGLTKGAFMKLFAVSPAAADELPRTTHKRYGGGSYYLYRQDAVDAVLAADGAMAAWRERLRLRGVNGSPMRLFPAQPRPLHQFRSPAAQEEYLHAREAQRREWHLIRAS